MLKLASLVFLLALSLQAQVAISGTFKYPDGSNVNGRVVIRLTRSTARNTCTTPVQIVTFRPVTIPIVNGVLGSLNLYANSCLVPSDAYDVSVFDQSNKMLYRTRWKVPKQSSANVTQL